MEGAIGFRLIETNKVPTIVPDDTCGVVNPQLTARAPGAHRHGKQMHGASRLLVVAGDEASAHAVEYLHGNADGALRRHVQPADDADQRHSARVSVRAWAIAVPFHSQLRRPCTTAGGTPGGGEGGGEGVRRTQACCGARRRRTQAAHAGGASACTHAINGGNTGGPRTRKDVSNQRRLYDD